MNEVVRVVKYVVHSSGGRSQEFAEYDAARAWGLVANGAHSVWRVHCYDDGNTTRYTRLLIVAFK